MLLRTLGDLDLEGSTFRRSKPLLLLAYLTIEGPKSRTHLAELFWPTATDPAASVRMALLQLRKGAPDTVAGDASFVRATVDTDATRLLQRLDAGDHPTAIELYRGPFLAGHEHHASGEELEEWLYATREYVAGRVRQVHLAWAEREAATGDLGAAARRAEVAWRLPGAPPADPDVLARLHRVCVAAGDGLTAQLVAEAATYGVRLALSGDEARRQLGRSGNAGETLKAQPLPRRTTSFVGRDPELVELGRLLGDAHVRLVTLVGAGGAGKTRLAVEAAAAEAASGRFPGGVVYVELAEVHDPADVVPAIARSLGATLPGRQAARHELLAYLDERPRLAVLDNAEHLVAAAPEIAELVRAAPRLSLLVTSRERLGLEDEQVFRVEGLPLPAPGLALGEARYQDAAALFVQRARRVRLDFVLDERSLADVVRICHLVDGSPLAIELAAAWVRVMPVDAIGDEIAANLDFLTSTARDVPARHESLRATFEHSWHLLSDEERSVLGRLAVFDGGFSREGASRVAGATLARLASLVDKSLVRPVAGGRYDRHPLVHDFTRAKLEATPDELARARRAHADFVVTLVESAEEPLKGPDQAAWFERLEAEHANVRAALTWATAHDDGDVGLRITGALWRFWSVRGHARVGLRWSVELLARASATVDALTRAKAASGAGVLAFALGDVTAAGHHHTEALLLRRAAGHTWGIAASLHNLGGVHASRGDHHAAEAHFEESLAILRSLDQPWSVASSLVNLGVLASLRGDVTLAKRHLEESLSLRRTIGDTVGMAEACRRLGDLDRAAGDLARARDRFREALSIEHEAGDVRGLIRSFETFAELALEADDPVRGVRLWAAGASLRAAVDAPPPPADLYTSERRAEVVAQLGQEGFDAAWEIGTALARADAVRLALDFAAGERRGA